MSSAFQTTVWALVQAAQSREGPAVQEFFARYRRAIVSIIVRWGYSQHDAEDLTHEVFVRVMDKDLLAKADRAKGKFRSYLIGIARNVVRDETDRKACQKRGRGALRVPLTEDVAVAAPVGPELDTIWLDHLLGLAFEDLARESPRQHDALVRRVGGASHEELARASGRSVQQVKNDLNRARARLARNLRAEIARYSSSPEEYEEEVALLLGQGRATGSLA